MAKQDVAIKVSLIDGVTQGLKSIEKSVGGVTRSIAKVGVAAIATAAAVAAIGIGAALTDGVKEAAKFEVSLDKISARSGVTGAALGKLGDQILKISENATKTGADGAAAFQKLAEEGLSAEQSLAALPAALDFATASSQGAAEAVGALADTLDQFGLSAENIPRAADVISQAALTAGTGVQQMQAALTAAGPTARDLGITLEQTAASIAVLAQNGIEGGKAGKQLVTIFDQLRDPTSKLRAELAKIGITSTDFKTVLAQLSAAGPKAAGAFNALGAQGTAALKALAKDGGGALSEIAQQLLNVEGATAKTANTINSNFTGALTRLAQAFDAAQVKFLTPLLGPLADEVDNIRVKLGEFVESPEFKGLSESFATAFLTALEAAKKFVAEFDLTEAIAAVEQFVKRATDDFQSLADNIETIAATIKGAISTLNVVLNAGQLVGAKIGEVAAKSGSALIGTFAGISENADIASTKLAALGDVMERKVGEQSNDLSASLSGVGEAAVAAAASTEEQTDALRDTGAAAANAERGLDKFGKVIPVVAQAQIDAAEKTRIANETLKVQMAVAAQTGTSLDELAGKVNHLGNQYNLLSNTAELAAQNDAINAKIKSSSEASFKKTQEQIQASIDASKNLSSSLSDVKDSAAEAADSMAEFGAAVAQDAGYSDAVFAALGARIDAIAPKIAAIKGVSEASIRDGVNQDTQGAVRSFTGMNNSLQALEEEFQRLGGDKTLQRMQAEAQRTADAIAGIGEAARGARDDLASLVEQLEAENAARNGNESTAEERRYQQELARIAELDRVSGGTAKAQADLARALAKQNHDARLAEIKEEARARVESETGADTAIAASRSGATGALPSGPASAQSASGLQALSAPVTITINALDLRNAPRFAAELDVELQRIRRNSR